MADKKYSAIAEIPVDMGEHDKLGLCSYANSLAKFVKSCVTPTTIAVQGDWGTGKTSLLNMVRCELSKEEYLCIAFNTWQYSQFEMADSLSVSFLTHFLKTLQEALGETKEMEGALETVKKVTASLAKRAAIYTAGRIGGDELKDATEEAMDILSSKSSDDVDVLKDLKEEIEKCIEKAISEKNVKRIVVFIDDLDRLNPVKAVELLEIIKIFLDCEGCVYVLALDTNVIKQGIIQKHGLSEEKSQAFFEKLIQLPFQMPVSYYDYNKYIESIFPDDEGADYRKSFFAKLDRDDKERCVTLMRLASDRNPRAAKRIINAFVLKDMVERDKTAEDIADWEGNGERKRLCSLKLMLALTCIQVKLEPDYQTIIDKVTFCKGFLNWLASGDMLVFEKEELRDKFNYSDEEIQKYTKNKARCGEVITIFKGWCLEYNSLCGGGGKALQRLLQSSNGNVKKEHGDAGRIARMILNDFENRLRDSRREIVLECMKTQNEDAGYEQWCQEARKVLESRPATVTYFNHQEMTDKILELAQAVDLEIVDEEKVRSIIDLYESMDSLKFQYTYTQMVEENFLYVVLKDLRQAYEKMSRLEGEMKEELQLPELFKYEEKAEKKEKVWKFQQVDLKLCDRNKIVVSGKLISLLWERLHAYVAEEDLTEMYRDICERIHYFFTEARVLNVGKGVHVTYGRPLPNLFATAMIFQNQESEGQFAKLEQFARRAEGFTKAEKEQMRKELEEKYSVWSADIAQCKRINRGLQELFQVASMDKQFKLSFGWVESEGEKIGKLDEKAIPQDYEKRRLKWYFGIVAALVYCEGSTEYHGYVKELRKLQDGMWKRIFRAVDIIEKEYIAESEQDEMKKTDMFSCVDELALEELRRARSNEDGWQDEELPEGFKNMVMGMLDEFLALPQHVMNSTEGSYELGMLVGRHFDEDAFFMLDSCFYREQMEDGNTQPVWGLCCFEKREDTRLWRYYEVFAKVINQLRIRNEEVQKILEQFMRPQEAYLMNAETDYSSVKEAFSFRTDVKSFFNSVQLQRLKVESVDLKALSSELKAVGSDLLEKLFEVESVYKCIEGIERTVFEYFISLGDLIYSKIPRFMDFVDTGVVQVDDPLQKEVSARYDKFWSKYEEMLELLRSLCA